MVDSTDSCVCILHGVHGKDEVGFGDDIHGLLLLSIETVPVLAVTSLYSVSGIDSKFAVARARIFRVGSCKA